MQKQELPLLLELAFLKEDLSVNDLPPAIAQYYLAFKDKLQQLISQQTTLPLLLERIKVLFEKDLVPVAQDYILEPPFVLAFLDKLQEVAKEGDILAIDDLRPLYVGKGLKIIPLAKVGNDLILPADAMLPAINRSTLVTSYKDMRIAGIYNDCGQIIYWT